VVFDPATGTVQAQLSVTLKNTAPPSGLPSAVLESPAAPGIAPGANYLWMSVYTPLELSHPSVDGVPLLLSKGSEFGVNVYSGWIDIPPQSTDIAKMSLNGVVAPSSRYGFHLRVQPSANPVATTVTVTSNEHPGVSSTWTAGQEVTQAHEFRLEGSS
jgi:hypothetical protein